MVNPIGVISVTFLAATLLLFGGSSFAATYQPSFEPEFFVQEEPVTRPLPRDGVGQIRVLIFPHLGRYSTPQGRETRWDSVTLESKGLCRLYADPSGEPLKEARVFTFNARDLASDRVLRCSDLTTLKREQGMKSFSYRGDFLIHAEAGANGSRVLQVVNLVPFETYLKGVVPSEVPAAWPIEAVKAQAVAARTYAIFEMLGAPEGRTYHVDDTVQYQAYLGASSEAEQTNRAVDATAGEVLTYRDEVIKAYFSADSGGYTEAALEVFGVDLPYCLSKPEVYDPASVKSEWKLDKSLADIGAKLFLGRLIPEQRISKLWIEDSQRTPSGRAHTIHARLSSGSVSQIPAFDFRVSLGLRSTWFSISERGGGMVRFDGRGWGHGVGMSQNGAYALAQERWDYRRILGFYYDETVLERVDAGF